MPRAADSFHSRHGGHRRLQLQLGADHRHHGPLHDQARRQSGAVTALLDILFARFRKTGNSAAHRQKHVLSKRAPDIL